MDEQNKVTEQALRNELLLLLELENTRREIVEKRKKVDREITKTRTRIGRLANSDYELCFVADHVFSIEDGEVRWYNTVKVL